MRIGMRGWAVLGLAGLLAAMPAAAAKPPQPPASQEVVGMDLFIRRSAPVCAYSPARACIEAAWDYADLDHDGELSLEELRQARLRFRDWFAWKDADLHPQEKASVTVGLLLLDMVGLDTLVHSYDTDGNGRLRRAELLADVRLDQRPLGQILLDPEAVDREAVAKRLGAAAPFLGMLLKPPAE